MIKLFQKKLMTAIRVARTQGIRQVYKILSKKLRYQTARITLPLRGDHITVDGCSFNLSDPLITREAKIALFAGQYEEYERPAIRQFIPRNLPVIELGAGMGIVSCMTNRLLINPSAHLVVEANPYILKVMEQNRVQNQAGFTVVNAALGYDAPELKLFIDDEYFVFSSAKKVAKNFVTVKTMQLKHMIELLNAKVVSVICDIEGMEVDLVSNEIDVLSHNVGVFLFEEHSSNVGQDAINNLFRQLEAHQFERVHHQGDVHVFVNRTIFPSGNGVITHSIH